MSSFWYAIGDCRAEKYKEKKKDETLLHFVTASNVLHQTEPCVTAPNCTVCQHQIAQYHCTKLHWVSLHQTALHVSAPSCIACFGAKVCHSTNLQLCVFTSNCTVRHCTKLNCMPLHQIVTTPIGTMHYYTKLHCVPLHQIAVCHCTKLHCVLLLH